LGAREDVGDHGTHFTASAPLYSPYGDQNPVSPAPTGSPNTAARF
jgi:hypothetical protein